MWHEEYENLMFRSGNKCEALSQAVNIKHEHMPDLLYKYRSVSDNSLSALQDDVLYSSPPHLFNDPFEGNIEISIPATIQNYYQQVYEQLRKNYSFLPLRTVHSSEEYFLSIAAGFGKTAEEITSQIPLHSIMNHLGSLSNNKLKHDLNVMQQQIRNACNICCLCEENNNLLMWSHYADQHKGFCIGYNIKALNNDVTELTFPVLYRDTNYYEITDAADINSSLAMYTLTLKSTKWSYEKEWRIFYEPKTIPHAEPLPTPCAIYLGEKMACTDESKVYNICCSKQIPIYKMNLCQRTQTLIPSPYYP